MVTQVILRNFQFSRDFRHILWTRTIWYNLLRAACAGLVFGLIMMLFPQHPSDRATALLAPVLWPVVYVFVFLPLGVALSVLESMPFAGAFSAFCGLIAVAIGDPIVCLLYKFYPSIVPVDSPPLFSFSVIFWVLDAPEISVAGDGPPVIGY